MVVTSDCCVQRECSTVCSVRVSCDTLPTGNPGNTQGPGTKRMTARTCTTRVSTLRMNARYCGSTEQPRFLLTSSKKKTPVIRCDPARSLPNQRLKSQKAQLAHRIPK